MALPLKSRKTLPDLKFGVINFDLMTRGRCFNFGVDRAEEKDFVYINYWYRYANSFNNTFYLKLSL